MASQKTDNICRLCLTIDDAKYSQLDDITKESLKSVVPELNFDIPANFVVCSRCSELIEESFSLKTIISKNEDLIRLEKERLKITGKVNINQIFKADAETGSSGENMCRLCLNKNEGKYTALSDIPTDVLETCLAALDKELTADPAVCESCYKSLQDMHAFKTECLSVEKKIKSQSDSATEGEIDLHKLLNFSKEEDNDFLAGFEVQDEEGGDIFDIIPAEVEVSENNRKRTASESHDEVPLKKPKLVGDKFRIMDDGLPRFKFNFGALYNHYKNDTVVEWLAKVDEIKLKENWSDYITINKVLVRLKDLNELCTWFSNISDVMNWDEWKKKLINAFPPKDDYLSALKRMLDRKKKIGETLVNYYNSKMETLEPLGIVGEKAVSCILGGVTNHVIGSIGRVGQYKTPEELLVYFKSCDDKAVVESSQNSADNKELEQKKANLQCTICHKSGHTFNQCWSKEKTAADASNSANNEKVAQTNIDTKIICDYCGHAGHKSYACRKKRREHLMAKRQEAGNRPDNANMKTQSPNKNKNKGANKNNANKGPNTNRGPNANRGPNTNRGPNANRGPNTIKGPNKLNTSKGPIKKNANKSPNNTNINKSPVGQQKKKRQRNRGPNGPNRNRSPNGPIRNRSPNDPNRNRSSNGPNSNRSPSEPKGNRGPNQPNMNRRSNESNLNRSAPNMNRSSNASNMNRTPNPPNMNRSSNGPNSNRGLSDAKCAFCGNFGHASSHCIFSNFARPSDTLSQYQNQDRQSDRYLSGGSEARNLGGQSYVGSYSNQKQLLTNRRLCLDCYQIGHETKDCTRYGRKPYAR